MAVLEVLLIRWIKGKIKGYVMKKILIGALKSKTIVGLGGVITLLTWLSNNTDVVNALVPADLQDVAGYVIALAIAVLRVVTKKPLTDK